MKYKKLMLVTFLLLAILTIGSVSASDDINDTLTVDNAQEEIINAPVEEINVNDDVLSYEASDFNVHINESMDLADEDAPAVTFDVPDGADGRIWVYGDYYENILGYDLDRSPLTLDDLEIYSAGTYSINVTFMPDEGSELPLASGTINVVKTLSTNDFYGKKSCVTYATLAGDQIFTLDESPAAGNLLVYVDGNLTYNHPVLKGSELGVYDYDMGIYGKKGEYHIDVKFNTTDGKIVYVGGYDLDYDIDESGDDFDADFYKFDELAPLTDSSINVFYLTGSPANGRLVIFADNKEVYNRPVYKGSNVFVSGKDLGITECGSYKFAANFTGDDGNEYFYGESEVYYNNASSFIIIEDTVDVSYRNAVIAYIRDNDGVNGTITLSINGKEYYNKKFDGTFLTQYIHDTDLEGMKITENFVGNYTVKVTYGDLTEESVVSFEFIPYIFYPYNVAAGEESYVVLKAAAGSTGTVNIYDSVIVDSRYDFGNLIGTYAVTGNRTNIPLPSLPAGYHVFFANFTVNGKNDMGGFRVYAFENSNNLTSEISSDKINVGESVTVTVTGPKKGGIDIYVDGDFCNYIPLENGTVKQVVSNLVAGTHVIAVSYDDGADFEEAYSKFYKVTVLKAGETADDNKTDDNPAVDNKTDDKQVDISNTAVVLSANSFTFNGKVQKPTIVTIDGKALVEGTDYDVVWSNPSSKNAGTYTLTITGKGSYKGTASASYTISKAANPLKVSAKTAKVKYSSLKKKAQTLAVSKVIKFTKKGQGTMTYTKSSGNKKITINKKTGKVTVKKGLKKGTYKVKVKVKAAGNANYKASAYKTVTFKIQVK